MPSLAATAYQLEGAWISAPATIATGASVIGEWRVSINDDAAAPQNANVAAAPVTFTAVGARVNSIPDGCGASSSISADGSTLTCELGTRAQGSVVVIDVPLLVTGSSGQSVTMSGSVAGVTKNLSLIPIVSPFAMDMVWNYSQGDPGGVFTGTYVDATYQWTLKHAAGAGAGPNSVSYDITVASAASTALMSAVSCQPFADGMADGHPWSGGSHPQSSMTNFVGTCTLIRTGGTATSTTLKLTLTGIDYSKANVPAWDSTGKPITPSMNPVASGEITVRIPTTATSGTAVLTSSAPTYTASSGATSADDASNNSEATPWTAGEWSNAWIPSDTGSTAAWWSGEYKVSPGMTVTSQAGQTLWKLQPPSTGPDYQSAFQCVILDTKYVTYASDQVVDMTNKGAVPGAVTYYYTGLGAGGIVDPTSASYNPNAFDCQSYPQVQWTTTKPSDVTQIKAVLVEYPVESVRTGDPNLYVKQTIKAVPEADMPQDVWEWSNFGYTVTNSTDWSTWTRPVGVPNTRSMNPDDNTFGFLVSDKPTPYNVARYPYSTAGRDLLWVIAASPTISKSVSPATVNPGDSTTFTITYAAEGDAAASPTRDVVVSDYLPNGMTYVPGSASTGEPVVRTSNGQTVLTWTFNQVPVNVDRTMTLKAKADANVALGSELRNWANATVDGRLTWASAVVRIPTTGVTRLVKTSNEAFIPNPDGNGNGNATWHVTVSSLDPTTQAYTDTIDVLPYVGDGRGTHFSGSYQLSGPVIQEPGATVYYTTASPGSIPHDPADPANGGTPGTVPAGTAVGWTTTYTPAATAVRVIGPSLVSSATFSFDVPYTTTGMTSGDTLVNVAEARAEHTALLMRTSAQVSVATYYSVSLKKYVLAPGADPSLPASWVDANDVATYPHYALGDKVHYKVVVTNTGAGTLNNVTVADDLQPSLGAFTVDQLAAGESQDHLYTVTYGDKDPSMVVNTACVTAATPAGSPANEVKLTCDPAGVLLENHPDLHVVKSSNPADGSSVNPGGEVTYTVTFTNTGKVPALADYTDHLAAVLDDATLDASSIALGGDDTSAVGFNFDTGAQTIRVSGLVQPGKPVTLSYTVKVNTPDTGDKLLRNVVTPSGALPGDTCKADDPLCTENPVATPGFALVKSADPASGSVVKAGDVVTYTVTGTNTGGTVLDPVKITDDLADVLDDATLVAGSPTASTGSAPAVSGTTLSWSGSLPVGGSVKLTYQVKVKDSVSASSVLRNLVHGEGTPPSGGPIVPPDQTTQHPVAVPGFTMQKVAAPASGTTVRAGDVITYQVTGTNTGNTALDPVTITDKLVDVLDNADLVAGSVVASAGDAPVLSGTTLTWTGSLDVGEHVTITYQVKVKATVVAGDLVHNQASSSVTPVYPDPKNPGGPGVPGEPITPPDVETQHPVPAPPGFTVTKAADPATGSLVQAGDVVTYTVTGSNTGSTVLDPVTITDNLADVLDNASLVDGSLTATTGPAPTVSGTTLTWTGMLPVGAHVTLTYQVKVKDTVAAGDRLHNIVKGTATPLIPDPSTPDEPGTPGQPITPPEVETEHPVAVPGFVVTKTAKPAAGTAVKAGDVVTYTVTGENTGTTVLDPVKLTDDLSGVLDDADLVAGSLKSSVGDAPSLTGTTLTWTGQLAPGAKVELTYQVKVAAGVAKDAVLKNVVVGSATPPGKDPITPPEVVTEHPVKEPGFTLTKSADPASGTQVAAGDVITYTVTGTNTGETQLDPVTITDDLSDVFDNADLVAGSPKSSTGATPSVSGDTLTWTGVLESGESVTLTYRVKVKSTVKAADLVHNVVSGRATPITPDPDNPAGPGLPGTPIVPPDVETSHPVAVPGFALAKSSLPGSGAKVSAGDVVTYTVTGSNTGNTTLDPVTITDKLSDVLDNADLVAGSLNSSIGTPKISGTTLTWSGVLKAAESVTISYQVKVKSDLAKGAVLRNVAHGEATPPGGGTPIVPVDPVTSHPVNVPGFAVSKSSDPATGVRVAAGQTITYTVTGANTGDTALDPVSITDDLSDVLDNADLVAGSLTASRGAAPSLKGTALTWTGSLGVGEHVVLTYQVNVKAKVAPSDLVHNIVGGVATPTFPDPKNPDGPGVPGTPITPPKVETTNPVAAPGFTLAKTADPVTGTAVEPGQTITYTVTGTNTGNTVLDPVIITDDLSGVLPHASLVSGSLASSRGERPTLSGTVLSWKGQLPVGASVVLTYKVKVDSGLGQGTVVENRVHGTATPPGTGPITPPDVVTHHPVAPEGNRPAPPQLAFTGADVGVLPWVGLGLLVVGVVTLLMARRRRA